MSRSLLAASVAFIVASYVDLATTFHTLHTYGSAAEANPFMKGVWDFHPFAFMLTKAAGTALIVYFFFANWHHRAYRVAAWIAVAFMSLVATWNCFVVWMLSH